MGPFAIALLIGPSVVNSLSLSLCSSQNTGASNVEYVNQYNSNGYCHDKCQGYAFGVVQGTSCWCSNYAPSDTSSLSQCDVACPGYGYEYCASQSDNLYGYVALGPDASGTLGGSSSTSGSNSESSVPSGSSFTSGSGSGSGSGSSLSSSSSSSSSSDSSSTSSPTPTASSARSTSSTSSHSTSASPVISTIYSVMTISGDSKSTVTSTILQTMTMSSSQSSSPSAAASSNSSSSHKSGNSFFDSKGKVAGVFTVVGIVSLGLLILLAYFIYKKCIASKVHGDDYFGYYDGDSYGGSSLGPNGAPRLDYSDLESNPHQREYEEKRESGFNVGAYSVAGTTTPSGSPTTHQRGNSFPVDPRLDPGSPLYRNVQGDFSNRSLSDQVDYSRKVLKVTNV
ncbi:hypothetical protein FOA43_002274 [Brettanomyces nanus]|uniref:WSC domain-containing protein n=1 Tax=Eeniella nana TaxID=13502 RepID=A0A875S0K4_EENNA|nr:uncharacterized protein FOA43_002274 [Brettanomyces nanus]QPG74936.1 hypothetical protein FOA43_002274 [Brettanomyces nanus]